MPTALRNLALSPVVVDGIDNKRNAAICIANDMQSNMYKSSIYFITKHKDQSNLLKHY